MPGFQRSAVRISAQHPCCQSLSDANVSMLIPLSFFTYRSLSIIDACLLNESLLGTHADWELWAAPLTWGTPLCACAWDIVMCRGAVWSQAGECTGWPGRSFLFLQSGPSLIICFQACNISLHPFHPGTGGHFRHDRFKIKLGNELPVGIKNSASQMLFDVFRGARWVWKVLGDYALIAKAVWLGDLNIASIYIS